MLKYRARLSGALADRIDMHVTLGAVSASAFQDDSGGETSATCAGALNAIATCNVIAFADCHR